MPETAKNQTEAVKTILFVEDDPVTLALYQDALENEGFHLECAQDGLAAFKILTNFVPDLRYAWSPSRGRLPKSHLIYSYPFFRSFVIKIFL